MLGTRGKDACSNNLTIKSRILLTPGHPSALVQWLGFPAFTREVRVRFSGAEFCIIGVMAASQISTLVVGVRFPHDTV